jgi:hypothetical protein
VSTPIQTTEPKAGVTVYQLVDPQTDSNFTLPTTTAAYQLPSEESLENPWLTGLFALATSILMLGIGWLLVGYWNMLT